MSLAMSAIRSIPEDIDPERVIFVLRTFIDRAEREEEHELTVQALVKVDADVNQVPSDASSRITPRKGPRLR